MSCSNDDRRNFERIFSLNQPNKCYDFAVESLKNYALPESCPILDLDDFYECKDDLVGGAAEEDQKSGDNFFSISYGLINNYAGLLVVVLVALFAYYLIINRLKKLLFSQTACEKNGKKRKSSFSPRSIVENENFENYKVGDQNSRIDYSQWSSSCCSVDRHLQSKNDRDSPNFLRTTKNSKLSGEVVCAEREKSNLDEPNIERKKEPWSFDNRPDHDTSDRLAKIFAEKDWNEATIVDHEAHSNISGVKPPKNSLIEFTDDGQSTASSIDLKFPNQLTEISNFVDGTSLEIKEIQISRDHLIEDQFEESQKQLTGYPVKSSNQPTHGQEVDDQGKGGSSRDLLMNVGSKTNDHETYDYGSLATQNSRPAENLGASQRSLDQGITERNSKEADHSNELAPKSPLEEFDNKSIEAVDSQLLSVESDDRNPDEKMESLLRAEEIRGVDQFLGEERENVSSHEFVDQNFDRSTDHVLGEQREEGLSCDTVHGTVSGTEDEIICTVDFIPDNLVNHEPRKSMLESDIDPDQSRTEKQVSATAEREVNEEVKKTYVDSTKVIELDFDVTVTTSQKLMPRKLEEEDRTVLENQEYMNLDANIQVFVEFFNNFSGSISVESRIQSIIQFESLEATFPIVRDAKVLQLALDIKHNEDTANRSDESLGSKKDQPGDQVVPDRSTFQIDNCENVSLNCELFAKYGSSTSDQQTVLCTIFHDKQEASADYFAVAVPSPLQCTTNNTDASTAPTGCLASDILPQESYDISVHLHNKFGDNGCTVEVVLAKHLGQNADRDNVEEEDSRLISLGTKVKLEKNVASCSQTPRMKNMEILSSETEYIQDKNYDIVQDAEIRLIRDDDKNLVDQRPEPVSSDDYDYDSAEFADNTTAPEIDTFLEIDTDNIMPQDQDVYDDENANFHDYLVEDGEKSRDYLDAPGDDGPERSRDQSSIEGDVEVKATVLLTKSRTIFKSQEECDIVLSQSEKDSSEIVNVNSVLGLFNTKKCDDVIHRVDTLEAVADIMRRAGLESSNLIFGIDYTASNKYQGEICFNGKSLHSIEPGVLNPYQQVISILGKTLAHFISEEGYLTAYGFGDEKTKDERTFPLRNEPFCSSFEEILQIYNTVTPNVKLGGPTNFAPLIYDAIELCKKLKEYHILVIVADGQVTNERATRRAIVEACRYPLSIIVVGVGDGPWDMMKVFDDMLPRRPWDNFHFIEFNEIVEHYGEDGNFETAFAVQSLLEIPDQYKIIKEMGMLDSNGQNE